MADGLKITVEFKTEPVTRFLERVIRDQIPFASALALTRTAQDARDSVIAGLDSKFILRNNWVKGGIRAQPARKGDNPPFAIVGTRDEFMVLQETGGTRNPPPGKHAVSVPVEVRSSKRQKIPRSKWPGKLAAKKGRRAPFFMRTGGGNSVLAQRKGKKPRPLKILYAFKPSIEIPKRFGFEETVQRVVGEKWADNAARALQEAILKARPPK